MKRELTDQEFASVLSLAMRRGVSVFYWRNLQGSKDSGVCLTLEGAKAALQNSILTHSADKDPNPWDGWEWVQRDERNHVFGGAPVDPIGWGEGFITEHKLT